jgi:Ran GTPase-activating protein (RanGAP) involved in mRNA processing and transport
MRAKACTVFRQALLNSSTSSPCQLNSLSFENDPIDLTTIAPCLSRLPELRTLKLRRVTVKSKTGLVESGFCSVFQALVASTVSNLDISHNFLTTKDNEALITLLSRSTSLQHISLGDTVGLNVSEALTALSNNPNFDRFQTLDLSWLNLSTSIPLLTKLLSAAKALNLLILDGSNLSPAQVVEVVSAVVKNVNIRHMCLCLRDLNLGSDRAALSSFAELFDIGRSQAFANVCAIKELHLDRNSLGCVGVRDLIDALTEYHPIEALSFDEVRILDYFFSPSASFSLRGVVE